MAKIEIGAGFAVTALAGFGLLDSLPTNVVLAVIGVTLILHGSYEIFFKPRMFLQKRLTKWLLTRNWKIRADKNPNFNFIIWAKDNANREVMVSRDKKDKGIIAFTALIHEDSPKDRDLLTKLDQLGANQRNRFVEDIKVFLASKDMGYEGALWPLNKLAVQHALSLDSQLSEHIVDLKAKEVINAVIVVRSLIRKAIIPLEPDKEGKETE